MGDVEVDVEKTTSGDEVAAWLRSRVQVAGIDPEKLRLRLTTQPDELADHEVRLPGAAEVWTKPVRDAHMAGRWWHVLLAVRVEVLVEPVGKIAEWLELGRARTGGVVEGQVPGAKYQLVWDNAEGLWLELAEAAVNQAVQTLAILAPVRLGWQQDDGTPNVVGDRPVQGR